MELFETLENRHSFRSFRPDPVPRELLDRLMYAASLAPSALNEQPWRFYVTQGETRRRLGEKMSQTTHYLEEFMAVSGKEVTDEVLRWYSELGDAPALIACTMPRTDDEFMRLNKHLSVGAAIEHILLAATDLGLAACNITFSFWVRDELGEILQVPEDRVIIAFIALGYPGDEPPTSPPHERDIVVYVD